MKGSKPTAPADAKTRQLVIGTPGAGLRLGHEKAPASEYRMWGLKSFRDAQDATQGRQSGANQGRISICIRDPEAESQIA